MLLKRWLFSLITLWLAACGGFPTAPEPSVDRAPVVKYALSLQGTPYRSGGNSPQQGFDCSGFVHHVYNRYGIDLPRSSSDMAASLPAVSVKERQPGDLLFFNTNGKSFPMSAFISGRTNSFMRPATVREAS